MEGPVSKESTKRIALVTGANKGIGLEICRQLASHGVLVILTARDEGRGTEAVEKLKSSGASDVLFHQLDVADPSSVASLANFVKTQFGKLDILVNNAAVSGVMIDHQQPTDHQPSFSPKEEGDEYLRFLKYLEGAVEPCEEAEKCFNTNYYGMKRVTEAMIPLLELAQSPRIVNVSSHYGLLSLIPNENIRKAVGDVDEQTEKRLDEVIQSFLRDLKEGKLKLNGWPTTPSAYKISKAAMNTYTRILAKRYPTFCINCAAPGFVKTDITYNTGTSTVEEGAECPVMLALLPDGSPSGLLYEKTKVSNVTRMELI